jgi:hypothetical protein
MGKLVQIGDAQLVEVWRTAAGRFEDMTDLACDLMMRINRVKAAVPQAVEPNLPAHSVTYAMSSRPISKACRPRCAVSGSSKRSTSRKRRETRTNCICNRSNS